jgi:phosphoserine phosphatase RsbU/P
VKVLIAEDEVVSRDMLERALTEWGFAPVSASDGLEAWRVLQESDAPRLAVLDWMMPGLDGLSLCRRLRVNATTQPTYVILLTGRDKKSDVVAGLQAGANDYITKPFDRAELRSRVRVGKTVLELQASLTGRVRELEETLTQVKQLRGLLPICSYCKRIRDDQSYWRSVEDYVAQHTEVQFSQAVCPDCARKG